MRPLQVLPGLHLCGEVLDVFGGLGGYNFYWAWVTGRLAGLGAADSPVDRCTVPVADRNELGSQRKEALWQDSGEWEEPEMEVEMIG